ETCLVLPPRLVARPLCALHRGGRRLRRQHAAAAAQVRDRQGPGSPSAAGQCRQADEIRRDLLRLDLTGDGRGDRIDRGARPIARPVASPRLPVPLERDQLRRRPRFRVRGRAEPRRPAALAHRQRMRHRPDPAGADPALRRHADHGALHRPRDRRPSRCAESDAAAQGGIMTYITKPKFHHPALPKNALGYTHRDYEGSVSTLCAGCGHDSISASIIEACFELDIEPHRVAKLSGIGCSSKTPTYFLGNSHGFNSVHGRMPSVLTGANLANRDLIYLGVSGDGDSASIGLGQFAHALRRGVNMVYIVENNGVYGLTKGQFSATADRGSKSKRGLTNTDNSIDLVAMALQLGATFVARSFSGDKIQMVPLI